MSIRHHPSIMLYLCSPLVLLVLLLTACGGSTASSGSSSQSATALKNVSIGLGYIPDIQFAPFYVAQSKGYYKAEGLNVTFNHGIVPDLIGSMVAGKNDFVFALIGYSPDLQFLNSIGVTLDPATQRPRTDPETLESERPGVYLAGVIVAGMHTNEIFIENGRFHGKLIAQSVAGKLAHLKR